MGLLQSSPLSSAGPEILAFGSHCSAKFLPILECFTPNFKLKYEDSENIKTDRLNAVVFNLHQNKQRKSFFLDTWYHNEKFKNLKLWISEISVKSIFFEFGRRGSRKVGHKKVREKQYDISEVSVTSGFRAGLALLESSRSRLSKKG